MGRSALSKLGDADELSRQATKIKKKDPESARELDSLARLKRKSAIRQMKRRPKKRRVSLGIGVA